MSAMDPTKKAKKADSLPERKRRGDRPIPEKVYPVIDTDLARDNLENDLTSADQQEL